jgi:hypothetical protein
MSISQTLETALATPYNHATGIAESGMLVKLSEGRYLDSSM